MNQQQLEELRRQMMTADLEAKKKRLREEFGAVEIHSNGRLPLELELEWYDYMCRFEEHYADVEIVNVWERLGQPEIKLIDDVKPAALQATFDRLVERLLEGQIVVDFLGDWDLSAAYRYITETLIYEEIEASPFENYFTHISPTTPAYDIEFWIEFFVFNLVHRDRDGLQAGIVKGKLCDGEGRPISDENFHSLLHQIWDRLPPDVQFDLAPPSVQIDEDTATAAAVISWAIGDEVVKKESCFHLQRHPQESTYWDIYQTTLFQDLSQIIGVTPIS